MLCYLYWLKPGQSYLHCLSYADAYPTIVTLIEIKNGVLRPEQLKNYLEQGGLALTVVLTIDAESVNKSLTSRDLKTPTENTLLGHVCWIRELYDYD